MNLFKEETILTTSNDNSVTLTTHRIRSNFNENGDSSITSMLLEHVSSVQLNSRTYPLFILIGVLMIIAGMGIAVYNPYTPPSTYILIILGVIIVALYFFIKQHTCIIASDGGLKIQFSTRNMKQGPLLEFIEKIEEAKHKKGLTNSVSLSI